MKLKSKFVLLALCTAGWLYSQQITGTVTGVATDKTGALIPGVEVKVTNLQTNVTRETVTDGSGTFSVPFLPAASYSLTATAKGFRTFQVESFVLQVGQTARVDLSIRAGGCIADVVGVGERGGAADGVGVGGRGD